MNPSHIHSFLILVALLITGCGTPLAPAPTQIPTLTYTQRTAESIVNGEMKEIELPYALTIWGFDSADSPGTSPHEIPARVTEDTAISRCPIGIVASLADFITGDKVVVEGRWEGETFVAKSVQPLFYSVEGIVTVQEGNQIETTSGTLVLDEDVRGFGQGGEQISGDELRVGVSFFGDYCDDPASDQRILVGFRLK